MHYNICNIGPLKLFSSRFFLLTKLMMSSQMSSKKRGTFVQERENPKVKITFFVVEEKSVILRFLLSKSERMNHRNTKCLLYTLKTFVSSSIIIIHFNFTNNTYIQIFYLIAREKDPLSRVHERQALDNVNHKISQFSKQYEQLLPGSIGSSCITKRQHRDVITRES